MPKKTPHQQQKQAEKRRLARQEHRKELRLSAQIPVHAPPRRLRQNPDETALRRAIETFAYQDRFKEDALEALGEYFDQDMDQPRKIEVDEAQMRGFQEWFIHDFVTHENARIIDLFVDEVASSLPLKQSVIAQEWQHTNRLRLLEVLDVQPGVGETVQDLLSGDVLECHDISMSRGVQRWSIVIARPVQTGGKWAFTGTGRLLPPQFKQRLVEAVQKLWQAYRKHRRGATIMDFYRDESLSIMQLGELVIESTPPPRVVTHEGHELVPSEAHYQVKNIDEARRRLDEVEEFDFTGPDEEERGVDHYVWLERGRSHVPEAEDNPAKGVQQPAPHRLVSEYESFRTLGDVTLHPERLKLSTMSRERLAAGKALLEDILDRLITHERDEYTDVEALLKQPGRQPPQALDDEESRAILEEMMEDWARQWPDMSLPLLDGKTPREAVETAKGRAAVVEVLKQIEFAEERKRRAGEPFYDVKRLRRELGLDN